MSDIEVAMFVCSECNTTDTCPFNEEFVERLIEEEVCYMHEEKKENF
jgi:hypothetical protein